jgi:hypothetical protein
LARRIVRRGRFNDEKNTQVAKGPAVADSDGEGQRASGIDVADESQARRNAW